MSNLDNEIQLNKKIFEDKQAFHAIVKVQKSLDKLNELLLDQNSFNIIILTRAVTEYNQLMSNMTICTNLLKSVHLKVCMKLIYILVKYILNLEPITNILFYIR